MSYVTISYAQSLDGRIATATGASRWISGEATLELAHELRASHDVILVGIGTVLADDPELTCRLPGGKSPRRVILDGTLRLPPESRIAKTAERIPTTVYTRLPVSNRRTRLEEAGVEVVGLSGEGVEHLEAALRDLDARGIGRVFVEGGSEVITSFLIAGCVDRLIVVTAPIVIGTGVPAVGELGIRRLEDALRPVVHAIRTVGTEVVHDLRFSRKELPR